MEQYIYYLLTVVGIGYFVSMSDLAKPFREWVAKVNSTDKRYKFYSWIWDKLEGVTSCIYCASFWIGLVVYISINQGFDLSTVFSAFSVMGFIYVVKTISNK